MWLFSRVRAYVDGQGTALDEGLPTTVLGAGVRPLVRVYPEMPLQVRFSVEALATGLPSTLEGARCLFSIHDLDEFHSRERLK